MSLRRLLFAVFATALLVAGPAFAADWIVTRLRGDVEMLDATGKWVPLRRGDLVANERVVRTLANGHAELTRSREVVTLGSNKPNTATSAPARPATCRPIRIVIHSRLMPGAAWQSAQSRVNTSGESQPRCSTTARRIRKSVAVPPPKDCNPSNSQTRATCQSDGGAASATGPVPTGRAAVATCTTGSPSKFAIILPILYMSVRTVTL